MHLSTWMSKGISIFLGESKEGNAMKQPLEITFHGMDRSDALEDAVRKKVAHLERFADDIMACRVVVDLLQKHQQQGRPFGVRIDLTVPGRELVVNRVAKEDVYVALRDAFDDMKRQLEDAVRQRRGDQKKHPRELHGEVVRMNADEGFGFIRTPDGEEYYFGRDNVAGGRFEQLQVGTAVQFIAQVAAEGRQAKRVSLGKHHVA
jgi:ribosomal subunit interface protein